MEQGPPLTRWQRMYRALWQFYGPAQVGLPPYATREEIAAHERANRPLPPGRRDAVPPGYRIVRYSDLNGVQRRTLVPDDAAARRPAEHRDLP